MQVTALASVPCGDIRPRTADFIFHEPSIRRERFDAAGYTVVFNTSPHGGISRAHLTQAHCQPPGSLSSPLLHPSLGT